MQSIRELLDKLEVQAGYCAQHGEFESVGGVCEACVKAQQAIDDARIKAEFEAQRLAERRKKSGIPQRFADVWIEDYRVDGENEAQMRVFDLAQRYVNKHKDSSDKGHGLLLYGGVGTGKTHLAAAIANSTLAREKSVLFTTATKAVRAVKNTYNRESELSEWQVMESFVKPYLLVIDELGVQVGTETEKNVLLEIINDRYNAMKPLIITSNLDIDGLQKLIGERALDRVREMCVMVPMQWESYRGKRK